MYFSLQTYNLATGLQSIETKTAVTNHKSYTWRNGVFS